MNSKRPKLIVEMAMESGGTWPKDIRFPHCDPRALHLPEECKYCADAKELQKEREDLNVSNTGHANRAWPCPADKARSSQSLNSWHGNRALTQDDLDKEEVLWRKLGEEIANTLAESMVGVTGQRATDELIKEIEDKINKDFADMAEQADENK